MVARDIELTLPVGARYALIGPNGAGKTTLINLMTGMLAPNAGQIFLGDEDITTLEPQQRVRRGLARTFQINTLFPGLNALEAVTLAVASGAALPASSGGPSRAHKRGDRGGIRDSGRSCGSATAVTSRRANCLTGASACWKSRWRWRPGRKCCCSTSRLPACRRRKAARFSRRSRACPDSLTLLFIEHDMHVVFRFATPYHRDGRRRHIHRRLAGRDRRRSGRARSLSGDAQTWLSRCLSLQVRARRLRRRLVLHDVSLELPEHGSLAVLGRNGVGKSTLLLTIMGFTQMRGGRVAWRGQDISRVPPHTPRRRRHRLGGAGARHLSLADRWRKILPLRRGPGAWTLDDRVQAVSAPRRAPGQQGQSSVRRRAADAGDCAGADDQSGVDAARRAVRGPGAGHRR